MAKPKIIIKPKKIITRKQRKTTLDTVYLLDEKKVHRLVDTSDEHIITTGDTPTSHKHKKNKHEYAGRKKDRKKLREKKRTKKVQEERVRTRKAKKRKFQKSTPKGIDANPTPIGIDAKPTPIGIDAKPTPIGIEDKTKDADYIPTVDIFDIIEDYIMSIPPYIETWRRGIKGRVIHDMQPFKMSLVSIVRDYGMSDDKEIEKYYKENEYAIKECIDSFKAISTEEELYTLEGRLVNLINMGHALSMDTMNYLELLEY